MKVLEIIISDKVTLYPFVNQIVTIDINKHWEPEQYCTIYLTTGNQINLTKVQFELYVLPYIKNNIAYY